MIFTSDEVTSENHWQIASRVTQKSLFTVTSVLFYFLHVILCPGTHNSAKNHDRSLIPMIFTSDEVTSENHWQIASRVTQKSLFTVTSVLFYFLHAILCPGTHNSAKNHDRSLISQLSPRTACSDFALWRHRGWSVTSRELEILALWRHIRRLFLHAQIGAKAIFTSE